LKTLYPEVYNTVDARFKAFLNMARLGPFPNAPGATDDCIFDAISSPRPPLSQFPGNFAGIPAIVFVFLARVLPESALLQIVTTV